MCRVLLLNIDQANVLIDAIHEAFPKIAVSSIQSVRHAKELISFNYYDILISNDELIDGNGIVFGLWLKARTEYSNTPIIILTEHNSKTMMLANKIKWNQIVLKPLNVQTLLFFVGQIASPTQTALQLLQKTNLGSVE